MSEQPRERDGKFSTMPLDEVDTVLQVVPKGSYLFPDFLGGAHEVVAFYDRVDIPDQVCMHVTSAYVAKRTAAADVYPAHYWDLTERPWRERNGGETTDAARSEFVNDYTAQLRDLPETLDPRDARVAAKVIGMNDAAVQLPIEEADMVYNTLVHTSEGEKTMREAYRDWALGMFALSTVDPSTYRAGTEITKADLDAVVRDLSSKTDDLRSHIDSSLRQTGTAIIDAI